LIAIVLEPWNRVIVNTGGQKVSAFAACHVTQTHLQAHTSCQAILLFPLFDVHKTQLGREEWWLWWLVGAASSSRGKDKGFMSGGEELLSNSSLCDDNKSAKPPTFPSTKSSSTDQFSGSIRKCGNCWTSWSGAPLLVACVNVFSKPCFISSFCTRPLELSHACCQWENGENEEKEGK